jgi:hypothetical protein
MDSGAFSELRLHGRYTRPVKEYAAQIKRFASNGKLLAAVAQDYMCETFVLNKTRLTVRDHQRMTVERYDELLQCDLGGIYIMPVLQGWTADDYRRHLDLYGARLGPRAWVGVGSVCQRRNALGPWLPLEAIKLMAPDLRLHGFGLKLSMLAAPLVRELLWSADSMAWSFSARRQGRDGNDVREAVRFHRRATEIINGKAS